jgi:hypothetical protein
MYGPHFRPHLKVYEQVLQDFAYAYMQTDVNYSCITHESPMLSHIQTILSSVCQVLRPAQGTDESNTHTVVQTH